MAFSRLATEHHLKIEIFFVRPEHANTVDSAGSVLNFSMKSAKFAIGLEKEVRYIFRLSVQLAQRKLFRCQIKVFLSFLDRKFVARKDRFGTVVQPTQYKSQQLKVETQY